MTSRDFDFETAIWDSRFSESMKSLLSPVDIAAKERYFEPPFGFRHELPRGGICA
jgi:hypothetical protein